LAKQSDKKERFATQSRRDPKEYTIRTAGTDSELREATLNFTARLTVVKGTFLFTD
jgi:hypothetical protein